MLYVKLSGSSEHFGGIRKYIDAVNCIEAVK